MSLLFHNPLPPSSSATATATTRRPQSLLPLQDHEEVNEIKEDEEETKGESVSFYLSAGPPPSYQHVVTQKSENESKKQAREHIFHEIVNKHEINADFARRLQHQLPGFKVVFIFDDSGSMNTVLQDSPLTNATSFSDMARRNNDDGGRITRWDELQYFASISIEIASVFDPAGCDVYFLNRVG